MRQAKITCRECDRLSLPYDIRKKIRGYETLTIDLQKGPENKIRIKT